MTLSEARAILKAHNDWRRGLPPYDAPYPVPEPHLPSQVGIAIDTILAAPSEAPDGWQLVPKEPTEEMWGGLARKMFRAWDLGALKPRDFLDSLGEKLPQWLQDEGEMKNLDHVPSKGTRVVIVWRAMLAAAPKP